MPANRNSLAYEYERGEKAKVILTHSTAKAWSVFRKLLPIKSY